MHLPSDAWRDLGDYKGVATSGVADGTSGCREQLTSGPC
jgi:hypothetical protein